MKERATSTPAKKKFRAVVEEGHKGPAIVVPFDPAIVFGVAPTDIPYFGTTIPGFPVRVSVGTTRIDTWIGRRWKRHFILAQGPLAKLRAGEEVEVVVAVRAP